VLGDPMSAPFDPGDEAPVYIISVAAQLAGLHPQTLRTYDRMGLVSPGQPAGQGRQRRYSLRDVLALREVQRLSQEEGVNLSGIKRILELDRELRLHQQHLAEMTAEMTQLRMELESTRAVAARLAGLLRSRSGGGQLVPVHGTGRTAARPGSPPSPRGEQRELPAAASRAVRPDTQLND
jgi:MerR family transcriptional regulator, heat shock protein HspR